MKDSGANVDWPLSPTHHFTALARLNMNALDYVGLPPKPKAALTQTRHYNPKAPRHAIYPAGSNAPGALHFGIDLVRPSDFIRRVMPDWEEPPVHQDLVVFDATVTAGANRVIDAGFLLALRDPAVVSAASRFGDPVSVLESDA